MAPRKERPRIIKAPQGLRQRAINYKTGFDLNLTDELRARIEATILESKDEFSTEVLDKLREMRRLAKEAEVDEFQRIFILGTITDLAFDVKGMGGTFGFPLLTQLAKSLHDFMAKLALPNDRQFEVISIHIDALYVVLARGISGTGGKLEQELLAGLRLAVEKTQDLIE
ncbi:hypothetical protein [Ferrovibrio sp.]|uniref:hypothetical protein n=1 Tax=Ferrovibrio sp. TaxID=1917215 RepID=UPI001B5B864B|nr:hypothetical protein [Ferrovibrio sp.]MBP7066077.1 hypothetical protein [Ferrovibrio sp.]